MSEEMNLKELENNLDQAYKKRNVILKEYSKLFPPKTRVTVRDSVKEFEGLCGEVQWNDHCYLRVKLDNGQNVYLGYCEFMGNDDMRVEYLSILDDIERCREQIRIHSEGSIKWLKKF